MKKAVVALAALVLVLYFWTRSQTPAPTQTEGAATAEQAPPQAQAETPAAKTPATPVAKKANPPTATPTTWAETLDEILRAEKPESEKAAQLLAALPNLQEADQIEDARHLVNLLADEEFEKVKPYLLNTTMPAEVISILFHDSMLRPETVKEPIFLAVMQTPDHPFAEEAKTALQLFVGEDYKTDWPQWETALREKLKANN